MGELPSHPINDRGERKDMTVRDAMHQSAKFTMDFLQQNRTMPEGAISASSGDRNDFDDYIYPRAADIDTMSKMAGNQRDALQKFVSKSDQLDSRRNCASNQENFNVQELLQAPPVNSSGVCIYCNWPGTRYRCSRCKDAKYCSIRCQKNHWSTHKLSCECAPNCTTKDELKISSARGTLVNP